MTAPVSTSTNPSNEPNRVTRELRSLRSLRLLVALTLLFIGLRCWMLTADAPLSVLGRDARELFAEPAAKSHEARNWAVFGAFKVSPVDDYQFWRAQSPATSEPAAMIAGPK